MDEILNFMGVYMAIQVNLFEHTSIYASKLRYLHNQYWLSIENRYMCYNPISIMFGVIG